MMPPPSTRLAIIIGWLAFVMALSAHASEPLAAEPVAAEPARAHRGPPVAVDTRAGSPPPAGWEHFDTPISLEQFRLANGLTVMLSENHERPAVFGAVVVRTGAKNDPADNTGMAHYLEHMLFKGTERLGTTNWTAERPLQERLESLYEALRTANGTDQDGLRRELSATLARTYAHAVPGEVDQLLELLGGTGVNAMTTWDETVFYNAFPASQLERWLEIYGQRFDDPVFRLFPTELEAVYEEKNTAVDTMGYELLRQFMREAFPDHGYRNDILGEVEHLKRPSLRAMKAYFARWYVPGNMALVVAGDFDTATARGLIETHFGRWRAGPVPPASTAAVEPFDANQRVALRLTPIRVGAIAHRTVPERDPEYATLQVTRALLSNAQRSGLIDRLSDGGRLLFAVHIPSDFTDHNLDVVAYIPRVLTQTFGGAERLVGQQFAHIAAGEFRDETLAAIKSGLRVQATLALESNKDRALLMAHAFVARGGWAGYVDFLDRVENVTKADVQRFAARTFGPRRLVIRSRMGFPKKTRLEKPSYPPVTPRRGVHSPEFERLRDAPSPAPRIHLVDVGQDVGTEQLAPHVILRTNANPLNDIYKLEVRFGAGTDRFRELDVLAGYLPRIGTRFHPEAAFREALFRISTTLEARAEVDRFTITLRGPERHMDAALALVSELLNQPSGDSRALRQLRRERWGLRLYARRDPGQLAHALEQYALYENNAAERRAVGPWRAMRLGSEGLLRAWKDVQEFATEIRYTGQSPASTVAARVQRELRLTPTRPAVDRVVYRRQLPPRATVYFVPRRGAVQTHMYFAVEGEPVPLTEVAAADGLDAYIGGSMAGLAFQEIREYRALAYSASAAYDRDSDPSRRGHLRAYVACQADKTFDALEVMLGIITDMPTRPERIDSVKAALLRTQESSSPSFDHLQDAIEQWERSGFSGDPRSVLMPGYERMQFADLYRFYREHVAGRPVAIMVVADPRRVRKRDLERYGKVVRLRRGKLFSH